MKVLSTTRLPGPGWDELRDVEIGRPTEPRPDVEVLIVPNETVDEHVLDLLPSLRLVANFSVGYDRIDVAACAARGVAVTNTPGVVDAATADLAMALVLATRRRLVEGDRHVRAGAWTTPWFAGPFLGHDVGGATLGIVGLGRIGSAVARRAHGFDMRVLYAQRHEVETDLAEYRELDTLLAEADVVSLHVPLSEATTGLIDARRLALLHDGATLVNTARGAIVDEDALVAELVSGRISAGLDVYTHEPQVPEELWSLPNVVLAPHLGSATIETRSAMARIVVDNVLALERGEPLLTPVSAP
jgi:lactate dehydrogenase-like 2-hydroxyacid dehydrogenase